MNEKLNSVDTFSAGMIGNTGMLEHMEAPYFTYNFDCYDADGNLKWSDSIRNVVTTVGKNDLLDKYFAGSAYTATWFCGLIASGGYTAVAAGDTMASHAGWYEAGGATAPTYTAPRKTVSFSAASGGSKSTSSAASFLISGTGTVQGAFTVGSTSATSTIDGTVGILYSASAFGSTRAVLSGDTLNVSLTLSV